MRDVLCNRDNKSFRPNLVPRARDPLVSIKKSRPLGEIGRWASISHSGFSLYACSETVIELEACAQSNRNQDFLLPVLWFRPEPSSVRLSLTENARALETRLLRAKRLTWQTHEKKEFWFKRQTACRRPSERKSFDLTKSRMSTTDWYRDSQFKIKSRACSHFSSS